MIDDPFLRALEQANPVPRANAELAPLGPLPPRRRRTVPVALAVVVLALATVTALALAPTSTPGANEVLARAFASDATVLYWRLRTDEPGLGTFTDDVWMRVRGDGTIDRVRELRLDGEYAGLESSIVQPYGIGDLRGAVTRTRSGPEAPIRTGEGIGIPEVGFTDVIATAERAARGALDVGEARAVSFEGREAYAVTIREAGGPAAGERRNPSELSVTLWLARDTARPLAVRWGEGDERWRTAHVLAFERLPDDADGRAQLELR